MTLQFILKSFTAQNIAHSKELLTSIFTNYDVSIFRYPTKIQKFTVLSSPHVHKKSREQFETRTHKMQITIHNISKSQMNNVIQMAQTFQLLGVQQQLRVLDASPLY